MEYNDRMNDQIKHGAKFVEEMKERLLMEKDVLLKELGGIAHKKHGDFRANYADFGRHEDENASEMAEFEARHGATEIAEERLEAVDRAIARIQEGKYGFAVDGKRISEERLRANPAAESE